VKTNGDSPLLRKLTQNAQEEDGVLERKLEQNNVHNFIITKTNLLQ
jgi:DNA-binding MltR family transcriptional regulator